jgi:Transposase, Mutator family
VAGADKRCANRQRSGRGAHCTSKSPTHQPVVAGSKYAGRAAARRRSSQNRRSTNCAHADQAPDHPLRQGRQYCDFVAAQANCSTHLSTMPDSQWRSVRTTNAVERLHEELKRRIKTQTVLPSAETAAMLLWPLGHCLLLARSPCAKSTDGKRWHRSLKLTRFRGHRTVWVQGVHDGQDKIALRT